MKYFCLFRGLQFLANKPNKNKRKRITSIVLDDSTPCLGWQYTKVESDTRRNGQPPKSQLTKVNWPKSTDQSQLAKKVNLLKTPNIAFWLFYTQVDFLVSWLFGGWPFLLVSGKLAHSALFKKNNKCKQNRATYTRDWYCHPVSDIQPSLCHFRNSLLPSRDVRNEALFCRLKASQRRGQNDVRQNFRALERPEIVSLFGPRG
jgi:hypothetical protein